MPSVAESAERAIRRYEDDVEAKAPRKRIPTQFDILQGQIGALNEITEELISRLQPILGEEEQRAEAGHVDGG
jgi:hypothetical protein